MRLEIVLVRANIPDVCQAESCRSRSESNASASKNFWMITIARRDSVANAAAASYRRPWKERA
jgi:hypothetical protein